MYFINFIMSNFYLIILNNDVIQNNKLTILLLVVNFQILDIRTDTNIKNIQIIITKSEFIK